jgi:DNA sulfur modification protein DndD
MIIKSISLRNFKSFGNNTQSLDFNTTTGDLILFSGSNGAGKSSFQQSFDFSLFGIVRGKNGKRVPQTILPNRVNKNLESEIVFINNASDVIKISRGLEPNYAKIVINDLDETKKFKNFKKEERDKVIGFDFETYKSFISMSVSDFANFIDLSPDEKRNIINRLFNIHDLDSYLSLSSSLIKQQNEEKYKYEAIIEANDLAIQSLNKNIINIKRSGVIDKDKEIKILEAEKLSKKDPFLQLKKDISKFETKISSLEKKRQDLENQKNIIYNDILDIKVEIRNVQDKLKVYESGYCPVCGTELGDEKHLHDLSEIKTSSSTLEEKFKILENSKNDLTLKLTQISNQKESLYKQKNNSNIKLNNLIFELKTISKKISELKEISNDISISELENNINELKIKNTENSNIITEIDNKIQIYNELKEVFSNNGIRRSIIKNIVKPINVYLKDILDEMKSIYNVKIDEEFNVNIYERMTIEVHPESLSMGESKKINIAIALSYLKLILKFRKLNILFLDEVFSSMEPDNVEYTLKVLKNFTKEFNLNIIILDPKVYFKEESNGYSMFDRVIKINKKLTFSFLNEETI